MMEERQASMMHYMREVMAQCIRNNGPSESCSAQGSAVVRASPRGAEYTAVGENGAEDSSAEGVSQHGAELTAAARPISDAGAATVGGVEHDDKQQQQQR